MSAIAGIYHLNDEPINLEHGNRMMKELEKYPADDIQTWHNDKVFLGCHAQWITPESVGEKLPYYDHERKLAITADAIIDNREELFERLQIDKGKRKNITDSELILLSYYKWEDEVPKYLVGDFAFMIWDEKKQKLLGARDFSGSRTLYIYRKKNVVAFCTIINPLLTLPYIEKGLNEDWLAEYLAIPGMHESVTINNTAYKDIEQIPPSHTITIKDGNFNSARYCYLKEGKQLILKSDGEYVEAFRDVFHKAVTSRLRTHHNVGAHLSGGLDSGSVVSFAARSLQKENKQLHTFSYIPLNEFVDWTPKRRIADERPFIKSTVEYVGNINDQYLSFEGSSPFSEIDSWLETMETPYKFFENSYWIKGIYEEAKKKGIGIMLNGARGNYTISWGPALDYYSLLLKRFKWIKLGEELYMYSSNMGIKKSKLMEVIVKKTFPVIPIPFQQRRNFNLQFINPEFASRTNVLTKLKDSGISLGESNETAYDTRKKQFEDLYFWNIDGTSGTKLSLRYSIWDRDPTNDLRVINFCLSVPNEQYVKNGMDRSLIRRATMDLLPNQVRLNMRKRGIQGADGILRMKSSWKDFIEEIHQLCGDQYISRYIDTELVKSISSKVKEVPSDEYIFHSDFKILMRSLIVYRFIKRLEGR